MNQPSNKQSLRTWLSDQFSDNVLRRLCYDSPILKSAYAHFTAATTSATVIREVLLVVDDKAQLEAALSPQDVAQPSARNAEALTTATMTLLGQYHPDQRADFEAELVASAFQAAGVLFEAVLERLKQDSLGGALVPEFLKNQAVYEQPISLKLTELLQTDAAFAAELDTLLTRYEQTLVAQTTPSSNQTTQTGDGAIAQGDGNLIAGKGGIVIGGNVTGNIILGGQEKSE